MRCCLVNYINYSLSSVDFDYVATLQLLWKIILTMLMTPILVSLAQKFKVLALDAPRYQHCLEIFSKFPLLGKLPVAPPLLTSLISQHGQK